MFKNILLCVFSILITLVFGEIIVRWVSPQNLNGMWIMFSEHGYVMNRETGFVKQKWKDSTVTYRFYQFHLRDTPYRSEITSILTLGDSFTFGMLLPWNQTYLYQLQEATNQLFGKDQYQFLNASTSSWGLADYLAYLEDYGEKIAPKYVLVFLNTDDIGRGLR